MVPGLARRVASNASIDEVQYNSSLASLQLFQFTMKPGSPTRIAEHTVLVLRWDRAIDQDRMRGSFHSIPRTCSRNKCIEMMKKPHALGHRVCSQDFQQLWFACGHCWFFHWIWFKACSSASSSAPKVARMILQTRSRPRAFFSALEVFQHQDHWEEPESCE